MAAFVRKHFHLCSFILIFVTGILVYANSLNGQFIFDDYSSITNNDAVRDLKGFFSLRRLLRTRSLVELSFAFNFAVHGLNPFGYHLINTLIHISNALLFFILLHQLFSIPLIKVQNGTFIRVLILLISLLFLTHPIQTQAVSYIAQRTASMAALFYLLTLVCYLKWREFIRKRILWLLLSLLTSMCAYLSKENTFTIPVAIGAIELFFFFSFPKVWYRSITTVFLYGILAFCIYYVSLFGISSAGIYSPKTLAILPSGVTGFYTVTRWQYLITQPKVIVTYFGLLLFPFSQNADYDFPITKSLSDLLTVASLLLLCALAVFMVVLFKKNRLAAFGIFFFFLLLTIESSVIPISEVIQEHRLYLPSIGFFIFLLATFHKIYRNHPFLGIRIIILLLGLIVLTGVGTVKRNTVWQTQVAFWKDVVSKSPGKRRGHFNLSNAYLDQSNTSDAIKELQMALTIDPTFLEAWNNLAVIAMREKRFDEAESLYEKAASLDPDATVPKVNLAAFHAQTGKTDQAIDEFQQILSADLKNAAAYIALGQIYEDTGEDDLALAMYQKAVEADPHTSTGYYYLGAYFGNRRQYDKAVDLYRRAIKIDPNDARIYNDLGFIYMWENNIPDAVLNLRKSVELDPKNEIARKTLDGLLTTD